MTQHENFTGHDWMTVYAYVDEHPGVSQGEIVWHFAFKTDDALIFTQSTLSRKLKSVMTDILKIRLDTGYFILDISN